MRIIYCKNWMLCGLFCLLLLPTIEATAQKSRTKTPVKKTATPKTPPKTETPEKPNSSSSQSQNSEPTLAETLEFLKGKIDGGFINYEKTHTLSNGSETFKSYTFYGQNIFFSNGKLEFNFSQSFYYSSINKTTGRLTTYNVFLRQLSFKEIEVLPCSQSDDYETYKGNCFAVKVSAFNNKGDIAYKLTQQEEKTSVKDQSDKVEKKDDKAGMVSEFQIYFSDQETANRVAKAFAHAIKLSGGKSEVF